MFDPEILGITPQQLSAFAQALIAPMLGFMFLFLLSLPLKKLPMIDVVDYKPPFWVLPLFAIGSFSLFAFSASSALTLVLLRTYPSASEFNESFQIIRRLVLPNTELSEAKLKIIDYDGDSNFRLYVNGYRVFGSSSNCIMEYQCRPATDQAAAKSFEETQAIGVTDPSIYHIHRLYALPYEERIGLYLIEGRNVIDIHSENSGLGDCRLRIALTLATSDASANEIYISPRAGPTSTSDATLQPSETFFSDGQSSTRTDPKEADDEIPVYKTRRSNGSFRLCQRIRIIVELTAVQIADFARQRDATALDKRRELLCEIRNDRPPECRK